jgi:hypothetical protein
MPRTASVTEGGTFQIKLTRVLQQALHSAGIKDPTIDVEPAALGKVRVWIVSDDFEALTTSDRQDIVWRALEKHFDPSDLVRISMVLTFTARELGTGVPLSAKGPVKGQDGTEFEIQEEELGHAYANHGTSKTCLFIVRPSQGEPFALYVWYSVVFLTVKGWNDANRWQHARKQVTRFLQARTRDDVDIAHSQRRKPFGEWKPTEDGWERGFLSTDA